MDVNTHHGCMDEVNGPKGSTSCHVRDDPCGGERMKSRVHTQFVRSCCHAGRCVSPTTTPEKITELEAITVENNATKI